MYMLDVCHVWHATFIYLFHIDTISTFQPMCIITIIGSGELFWILYPSRKLVIWFGMKYHLPCSERQKMFWPISLTSYFLWYESTRLGLYFSSRSRDIRYNTFDCIRRLLICQSTFFVLFLLYLGIVWIYELCELKHFCCSYKVGMLNSRRFIKSFSK